MLNFYKLEQEIEEQMRVAKVPGLALVIVQNQEVIYARGFGVTSVEDGGLPVTPQTLFRIGSITKALTGTAVMRLVEADKLNLDTSVKQYIPWLTFTEKGAEDRITLRMLLSHTSGLPADREGTGRRDPRGLETYVREKIPQYSFVAPPGQLYTYSNPGINLAGYLAETASGKHYAQLMHELVFDPLEMRRTTFDPIVAMTYPMAQAHILSEDSTLSMWHHFYLNTRYSPAGRAVSTVLDLANFAIMQMNQGRFRNQEILSPKSVTEMQTVHMNTHADVGTGLTFFIRMYKGARLIEHSGGPHSYGKIVMAPAAGVAVLMLFNRTDDLWHEADKVVDQILGRLLDLEKETFKP